MAKHNRWNVGVVGLGVMEATEESIGQAPAYASRVAEMTF